MTNMAITTTEHLTAYLAEHHPDLHYATIERVTEGSSNYVWRITLADKKGAPPLALREDGTTMTTMIVKHAEPHLAAQPDFPFPVDRMAFEVCALTEIPRVLAATASSSNVQGDLGASFVHGTIQDAGLGSGAESAHIDTRIRVPRVLSFDEQSHVLFLEDVGHTSLAEAYTDPALDIPDIGKRIGTWLARLHVGTTAPELHRQFEHPVARRMYRWNFNNLAAVLERHGHDGELGRAINARYGAQLETDDECVCHGDMWPGNILLRSVDAHPSGSEAGDGMNEMQHETGILDTSPTTRGHDLVVIDWEVARNGTGATDVGHFSGEAWLLDTLKGSAARGSLLDSFLVGYMVEKARISGTGLKMEERWRIAAQFATHVTHWPTIYGWINEDETRRCVEFGASYLSKVDQRDEEWFRASVLAPVFA
ncbi:kinase-like domain-containing protein [Microdochium trichocladiopsis]|uniref:Kinase-like domain-containing protein n=1 Tax=Microdochium trichocladiopsis TaxID=1682393 RepID=A0A9P9BIQ4_9PEZI|nr:kinase-like domain-containing protein [Microdochium trichocladiopsis]KAH7024488.1 kinase-like domain-containing protein [Microdochium trichocladiopsis]